MRRCSQASSAEETVTFSDTCGVQFRRHAVGRGRPTQAELTPADGWAACHGLRPAERVVATPQKPPNKTTSTSSRGAGRIADTLYDAAAVLSKPSAFKAEDVRARRDPIVSNLERAWGITGRSEDELTGVMLQMSQVVARKFMTKE